MSTLVRLLALLRRSLRSQGVVANGVQRLFGAANFRVGVYEHNRLVTKFEIPTPSTDLPRTLEQEGSPKGESSRHQKLQRMQNAFVIACC